jgi:hypothetical protein
VGSHRGDLIRNGLPAIRLTPALAASGGLQAGEDGTFGRVAVESERASSYAPAMARTELDALLKSLLATPEPPALDGVRRRGTLPAAELEARLSGPLREAGLPAANAALVRALVLLWHDHLDGAHTLAQGVENADGSFVHAIMHRREPDAWNSKYWWRRVGSHAAFPELAREAKAFLDGSGEAQRHQALMPGGRWDPGAFVDACEAARQQCETEAPVDLLRELQRLETETLLRHLLLAR